MSEKHDRFSRRDLLRLATGLAGGLIISPILQACQKLGLVEPTGTPVPTATQTIETSRASTPVTPTQAVSTPTASDGMVRVALVRTRDRQDGVRRAIS